MGPRWWRCRGRAITPGTPWPSMTRWPGWRWRVRKPRCGDLASAAVDQIIQLVGPRLGGDPHAAVVIVADVVVLVTAGLRDLGSNGMYCSLEYCCPDMITLLKSVGAPALRAYAAAVAPVSSFWFRRMNATRIRLLQLPMTLRSAGVCRPSGQRFVQLAERGDQVAVGRVVDRARDDADGVVVERSAQRREQFRRPTRCGNPSRRNSRRRRRSRDSRSGCRRCGRSRDPSSS